MRFGESILEALTREVKEETGLDVEEAKLAHIISNFWDLTGRQTVEINFLVTVKRAEAPVQLDDESDDWKWADPNDPSLHPHLRRMLRAFSHQVLSYRESDCKFRVESPTAPFNPLAKRMLVKRG